MSRSISCTCECPYDPTPLVDVPIGMFHCPKCGEMVVAGAAHPKCDEHTDWSGLSK